MPEKLIITVIFVCVGILFFFNNKSIAKGAVGFYKKLYTEENLKVMFKICGAILVLGGLLMLFTK